MDQGRFSTMTDVHRLETLPAGPGKGTVLAAWERFVQGEDRVPGVRPKWRSPNTAAGSSTGSWRSTSEPIDQLLIDRVQPGLLLINLGRIPSRQVRHRCHLQDQELHRWSGSGTEEVVPTGSAEQDPLAQQGEAGASVHLPLQEFELGVGALDRAVAVRQAQPGDDGVEVLA
jgi:hypothetical protein